MMSQMIEKHNELVDPFAVSSLAAEVEFLAARALSIGSAMANRQLEPFGLKVRSYSVLSLACEVSPPSQRQLAEFLRLDPSQIVALVDGLEGSGLVVRSPDPGDRRSNIISATAAGRAVFVKAHEAARRAEAEALSALSPLEQEQLRQLLARVAFDS